MKDKKKWLIVSLICVAAGIVIMTAGSLIGGRPGFYIDRIGIHKAGEIADAEPVKGFQEFEEFDMIELDVDDADIEIVASDRFAVEYCLSGEYGEPVCKVENGKLIFDESRNTKLIFMNIGFFIGSMGNVNMEDVPRYYVKIEIPDDKILSKAFLAVEEGSLKISSLQAGELRVKNEYGSLAVDEYEGEKLKIDTDSGDLTLGILKTEQAEINNEYGKITVSEMDGSILNVKQDSGDCQVACLNVSDTEIENEYGNVSLGIPKESEEYSFDLSTEYGRIYIKDKDGKWKQDSMDDGARYTFKGSGEKKLKVFCEDGNINIDSVK